jgi:hypothetical protein
MARRLKTTDARWLLPLLVLLIPALPAAAQALDYTYTTSNGSAADDFSYTDGIPPTVTLATPATEPTNLRAIQFTATFSRPVRVHDQNCRKDETRGELRLRSV